MCKGVKLSRKLVKKEQQKLSKQEKKRLADANWVGKGETRAIQVFSSKKEKRNRPNIDYMYRCGMFD